MYDEARLRAAGAESRASPTEPVEIPFCEGLEIVSAANVQQSPALLGADAGAGVYLTATRRHHKLTLGRIQLLSVTLVWDQPSQTVKPHVRHCGCRVSSV